MADEIIVPLNGRILFRHDDAKSETKGGIVLPDKAKQKELTGRIVEIACDVEADEDLPIRKYDKVLIIPVRAIPVDFESDNKLFLVPATDIIAVFKKPETVAQDMESDDAYT